MPGLAGVPFRSIQESAKQKSICRGRTSAQFRYSLLRRIVSLGMRPSICGLRRFASVLVVLGGAPTHNSNVRFPQNQSSIAPLRAEYVGHGLRGMFTSTVFFSGIGATWAGASDAGASSKSRGLTINESEPSTTFQFDLKPRPLTTMRQMGLHF